MLFERIKKQNVEENVYADVIFPHYKYSFLASFWVE